MIEIDDIEVDSKAAWPSKKRFHFEHAQQIVARVIDKKLDITGNCGTDWTILGLVCGIFGEDGYDLFDSLSRQAKDYDHPKTKEKFAWCEKNTKLASIQKLIAIAKAHEVETSFANESQLPIDIGNFMDDSSEEQIEDARKYGIYVKNNAYYAIELKQKDGEGYSKSETCISNFSMEIKYMIKSRKRPLRVICIRQTNFATGHVSAETVEVDTAKISSKGKFDEFVQGIGPYKFYGTDKHFTKLQLKYFAEEKPATVIEVLGQNREGYFFNNGAIRGTQFYPGEVDGIVRIDDKIFYVPSGNEANHHDETENINERKFTYRPSEVTFKQWSDLYVNVYRAPGMVGVTYGCACLFSDIIFNYCKGFLLPMFYGAPGSGKGSAIKSLQCLWGEPQDPLNIPSKANTDKGKIRKLAQLKNALVLLEEIPEMPSDDIIEFLKNLWDRYGYTKAERDHSFKTSQTPINSGVMITSNYYPKWNDPLLTRLLVVEVNKNEFTREEAAQFTALTGQGGIEERGITSVTAEVLQHREAFIKHFPAHYARAYSDISAPLRAVNVKEDRMMKNASMLLATYTVLKDVLAWPFDYEALKAYLVECLQLQQSKRAGNGKAATWWSVFTYLIKKRQIRHGIDFDIKGPTVSIVWMGCYSEYMLAAKQIYNQIGTGKEEMLEALKTSEAFVGIKETYRFKSQVNDLPGRVTRVVQFDLNKLNEMGYDISGAVQATQMEAHNYAGANVPISPEQEEQIRLAQLEEAKEQADTPPSEPPKRSKLQQPLVKQKNLLDEDGEPF
jgi:hypothetical protein